MRKILFSGIALVMPTLYAADPVACEKLTLVGLKSTTVTLSKAVAAGAFTLAGAGNANAKSQDYSSLPAFCRVAATIRPSADSEIKMEVWMPAAGWNGKFQAVGNGGWSGSIGYAALQRALLQGYAAASTNTGHDGDSASFAMGHPEKLIDFGWRAVHETVAQSKTLIAAYYGSGAKYSYWNGCSSGGKQALKEAQRFPNDFDGIIAGAPANNWIHQKASVVAVSQAVHKDEASFIPASKYPAVHKAVLEACDVLDGVKDGLLENPLKCKFDMKSLECKSGDADTCLTHAQVIAAEKIVSPTRNPRTGQEIFPGITLGTELGWGTQAGKDPRTVAVDLWMYVIFQDPKWDYMTLDLDKDVARGDKFDKEGPNMAATDPDLSPFFAHNGKLLMYHGWSDANIVPTNSVNYYKSVVEKVGPAKTADNMKLFMVPGMAHCGGGEGPNTFDMVSILDQWVTQNKTPARITASRVTDGKVVRTRPLCAYPQQAHYNGTGSIDDAANFSCVAGN